VNDWRPPLADLHKWVAAAEGVGASPEKASANAEQNLRGFLRRQSVFQDGQPWTAEVEQISGQTRGWIVFRAVVKCRTQVTEQKLRLENGHGPARSAAGSSRSGG
jgi:hypothetical protein